jgi:XisH protein
MAKDTYHEQVKKALEKDGWIITDDPLTISTPEIDLQVDLGLERVIGAERGIERIAVEIKSFLGRSKFYTFYEALGQTLVYRLALADAGIEKTLYLAIPEDVYELLVRLTVFRRAIEFFRLNLLIFDSENKIIVKWLKQ